MNDWISRHRRDASHPAGTSCAPKKSSTSGAWVENLQLVTLPSGMGPDVSGSQTQLGNYPPTLPYTILPDGGVRPAAGVGTNQLATLPSAWDLTFRGPGLDHSFSFSKGPFLRWTGGYLQ